jgi:hypothetical protein
MGVSEALYTVREEAECRRRRGQMDWPNGRRRRYGIRGGICGGVGNDAGGRETPKGDDVNFKRVQYSTILILT